MTEFMSELFMLVSNRRASLADEELKLLAHSSDRPATAWWCCYQSTPFYLRNPPSLKDELQVQRLLSRYADIGMAHQSHRRIHH